MCGHARHKTWDDNRDRLVSRSCSINAIHASCPTCFCARGGQIVQSTKTYRVSLACSPRMAAVQEDPIVQERIVFQCIDASRGFLGGHNEVTVGVKAVGPEAAMEPFNGLARGEPHSATTYTAWGDFDVLATQLNTGLTGSELFAFLMKVRRWAGGCVIGVGGRRGMRATPLERVNVHSRSMSPSIRVFGGAVCVLDAGW